jgi:hypothetical protein
MNSRIPQPERELLAQRAAGLLRAAYCTLRGEGDFGDQRLVSMAARYANSPCSYTLMTGAKPTHQWPLQVMVFV